MLEAKPLRLHSPSIQTTGEYSKFTTSSYSKIFIIKFTRCWLGWQETFALHKLSGATVSGVSIFAMNVLYIRICRVNT